MSVTLVISAGEAKSVLDWLSHQYVPAHVRGFVSCLEQAVETPEPPSPCDQCPCRGIEGRVRALLNEFNHHA